MSASAQSRARARLRAVYPQLGLWTAAALWHGRRPAPPVPDTPLADELDEIHAQRLTGLLARYVRESGATLDPALAQSIQRTEFAWTTRAFAAVSDAVPVLAELGAAAGGELPISKGPGVARYYPGPQCRPFSDIDVVVPPERFGRVVAELQRRGWAEEARNLQPWAYFTRLCREGVNLRERPDPGPDEVEVEVGGSIDVHHRLPPWNWSTGIDLARAAGRAEVVEVGGRTLRCLSPVDNLLVVALHVISDRNAPGRSLIVWRDLVELANAAPVPTVVEAATEAGLAGWVKALLEALPEPFGTAELAAALPDQPIPHPRRLAFLLSDRASRLGVVASQFLRLPLPNGLAFVAGMTVPSRAFLARKYPDEPHRYRRWWANSRERLA